MSGTFTNLNSDDFQNLFENGRGTGVVFFHKNTCLPCKMFHNVFESVSTMWYQKIPFYKFDAIENPEIAQENVGQTYPTVIFFDQGVPFAKHIGGTNSDYFNAFMQKQMVNLAKKRAMPQTNPAIYPRHIVKG